MTRNIKGTEEAKPPRFIECIRLEEMAVNNLVFEVERDNAHEKGRLSVEISVDTNFDELDEGHKFVATCKCEVSGKTTNKDQIFDLQLEYLLKYDIFEEHDWPEEEIKFFVDRNVIIHVWPYMREFVDQLSVRAGLSRVLLPMIPAGALPKNNIGQSK